jgi:hypothetical protein
VCADFQPANQQRRGVPVVTILDTTGVWSSEPVAEQVKILVRRLGESSRVPKRLKSEVSSSKTEAIPSANPKPSASP